MEPSEQADPTRKVAERRTRSVNERKSTNLKSQRRTATSEHSFRCKLCPRKFFTQRQLRCHKQRRHGIVQTKLPFKGVTEVPEWNSIPRLVHKIIEELVKDKYHLHYGILSKGLNYVKAGSDEAENLEKILKDLDSNIL